MYSNNKYVSERLSGIRKQLISAYEGGASMSSASKGLEREYFLQLFLSRVFPSSYRFGSGEITDMKGQRSGQLDIVVEYPFLPSLPVIGLNSPRLYIAEGIVAVIEVKSDIKNQWHKVLHTAGELSKVRRVLEQKPPSGSGIFDHIPLIAVGYKGWKSTDKLRDKLRDEAIEGILNISDGLFVAKYDYSNHEKPRSFIEYRGDWALWGLISVLSQIMQMLYKSRANLEFYGPNPKRQAANKESK